MRLSRQQLVANLLKQLLVISAGLTTHIANGKVHHVRHFRNHIDLALKLVGRVHEDGGCIGIT